jgi:hypothetical protein
LALNSDGIKTAAVFHLQQKIEFNNRQPTTRQKILMAKNISFGVNPEFDELGHQYARRRDWTEDEMAEAIAFKAGTAKNLG